MKYFKDNNNNVYAYELDGSQDNIIPNNYISITKEEANTLSYLPKTQEQLDKETKKASGKQKLLDLGLTEEEVKALIGV